MSLTSTTGRHSPAVEAFIGDLFARFAQSIGELSELVVEDMQRQLSVFANLDEAALRVFREALRQGVGFYLESVPKGDRMSPEQIAGLEAIAGHLGGVGLTHDDVAEGMRLATRRAWMFLVERAIEVSSSPAAVEGLGAVLLETLEFLQDVYGALARGFVRQHNQQVTQQVQEQNELLHELLSGAFDSDEALVDRSRQLGRDFGQRHGLLLLLAPPSAGVPADVLRTAKAALLAKVPDAFDGPLRTAPAPHAVVLVPAPSDETWRTARRQAVDVAVEQGMVVLALDPVAGPSSIHRAYVAAARDVPLAATVAEPGEVRSEDLGVFRVLALAGPDEGTALLARTLGPLFRLTENRRETLLETLDALWANEGRVVEAADTLAITERALRYRIRRLQELTGLDPDNPSDRLQLDLARHALRLYPDYLVPERGRAAVIERER